MEKIKLIKIFMMSMIVTMSCDIKAQHEGDDLTEKERQKVITTISDILKENYVFPEVAGEMADDLASKFSKDTYSKFTQAEDFADELTKDLQAISQDKHLRVIYDPEMIQEMQKKQNDGKARRDLQMQKMQASNFGFKEVNILEGNIGYINLTNFFAAEQAGKMAVSAMDHVKNSDALIIDLRENGGGSPTMIQLLSTYFFDEPVHLNSFYFRPTDSYEETWTLERLEGKKMTEVPIVILTSNNTFSAAEEFTYNLKNLQRATIVGEVTGGGAHPGGPRIVSDKFMVWVPTGRAINPVTNTNWEGIGVIPDIEVSAGDALEKALEFIQDLSFTNK